MATIQFGNTSVDMRQATVPEALGVQALRSFVNFALNFEAVRDEISESPTQFVARGWNAAGEMLTLSATGNLVNDDLFAATELAAEGRGVRWAVSGSINVPLDGLDPSGTARGVVITGTDGTLFLSASGFAITVADALRGNALFRPDGPALSGPDAINGGSGNDYLLGYGGNDTINGGSGSDTLDGGTGTDALAGGPGDDLYLVNDADTVSELPGEGFDTVRTTLSSFTLPANVERLEYAGSSSFRGTGSDFNDVLKGGPGNDTLDGAGGSDTASYSGAFRKYTPSSGQVSGPNGTDTLVSIENLAFVDGRLTFDAGDPMAQAYRLYFATLDRAPDALGLNFQSARLKAGTALTDVAAGFVNSPEFQATYGSLDDAQFVNLLYQNVLDRSAAPGEIAFHVGRLQAGASRSDVVVGFSESPEHIQKHSGAVNAGLWDIDESMASVARLYFGMLERTPETSGLAFYAQQFANGLTVQQVANGFAASPEFRGKYGALDNAGYVTQLYANILERAPGADEVAFHVNRLAAGATRGDVAAGFTEAPEYQVKTLAFIDQGIAVADAGFVLT